VHAAFPSARRRISWPPVALLVSFADSASGISTPHWWDKCALQKAKQKTRERVVQVHGPPAVAAATAS